MPEHFRCGGSDILVGYLPGFEKSPDWAVAGSLHPCPACGALTRTHADDVTVRIDEHLDERCYADIVAAVERSADQLAAASGMDPAASAWFANAASMGYVILKHGVPQAAVDDEFVQRDGPRDLYQECADAGWSHDEIMGHYA